MPPSGFNPKAIRGLLQFLEACYEDLLRQLRKSSHPGDVKKAIRAELADISAALSRLSVGEPRKRSRSK